MATPFSPRLSEPVSGNKFYIRTQSGGYSSCIAGCDKQENDVLNNCVGYAIGRYNEIYFNITKETPERIKYIFKGNAKSFIDSAKEQGFSVSEGANAVPALGSIVVWNGTYGHVAVVEQIIDDNTIKISHSGYNSFTFRVNTLKRMYGGWYSSDTTWLRPRAYGGWKDDDYRFLGFIYNKAVTPETKSSNALRDSANTMSPNDITEEKENSIKYSSKYEYNESAYKEQQNVLEAAFSNLMKSLSPNGVGTNTSSKSPVYNTTPMSERSEVNQKLLSSPTLVEVPFASIKIGDYEFGMYKENEQTNDLRIPNYIDSVTITKINGELNTYQFKLKYIVRPGEDPNYIDKVFGSVADDRTVKISYGDLSTPTFVFREETAVITKVTSQIDFSTSTITYNISATSDQLQLKSIVDTYPESASEKPSTLIRELIEDKSSGLTTYFPGLENASKVIDICPTDDLPVYIEKKVKISTLDYLNYLVRCMKSSKDSKSSITSSSSYFLYIEDDVNNEYGGAYFRIVKVESDGFVDLNSEGDTDYSAYVVDVGYPENEMVSGFTIRNDNEWSLLYKYSEKIDNNPYVYKLDENGNKISVYSPGLTTSTELYRTSNAQKSWWTNVTQFPIQATLTIRGMLQPILLISYIRVNAFFYGIKHIASGLYIVTKQVDTISSNGCRTELTLLRVLGDNEK